MRGKRIRLLVWKEFTQLRRDRVLLAILFVQPILQLVLLGYVVSADVRHLATAVVDLDRTATSQRLESAFSSSDYFTVVAHPDSEAALAPLLDSGAIRVALVIPDGTQDRMALEEKAPVGVIVDGTDAQVSGVASGYAVSTIAQFNLDHLAAEGVAVDAPGVDARVRVLFNPSMDAINTMIPALVVTIMMISLMVVMSQAVVKERESGTLEQMFVTPLRPSEYLVGKVAPYAALACVQVAVVAAVGILWFKVPFNGGLAVTLVGLLLFLLTSIGLGLLVSLVSRTRQQAQQTVMFIMIPFLVLSGFIFPIESMPAAVQPLTSLIPLRYALEVIRGSFVKGMGFADLAPALWAMAVFAVVVFGAAVLATRRRLTE